MRRHLRITWQPFSAMHSRAHARLIPLIGLVQPCRNTRNWRTCVITCTGCVPCCGAQQAQQRQRYINFIGESPPNYTDTRWSSSMETARHHGKCQWLKQEVEDHKKKRVNEVNETGDAIQLPTVLQNALDVLVDVVPKGAKDGERRPIAHRLYTQMLELEAKLKVQDVTQVPRVACPP